MAEALFPEFRGLRSSSFERGAAAFAKVPNPKFQFPSSRSFPKPAFFPCPTLARKRAVIGARLSHSETAQNAFAFNPRIDTNSHESTPHPGPLPVRGGEGEAISQEANQPMEQRGMKQKLSAARMRMHLGLERVEQSSPFLIWNLNCLPIEEVGGFFALDFAHEAAAGVGAGVDRGFGKGFFEVGRVPEAVAVGEG